MVGVVSTWEPYASILAEMNPDFRVVCDSSRAPYLVVDLLVAEASRATQIARSREMQILGDLYDQAVRDRRAHQEGVMKKLYARLGTHEKIYQIGRDGVQFFQRSQMKFFFEDGGRELEKIFEEVALAWGKSEQVDESRKMTPAFRRHVRSLFDPPDPAYAWLGVARVPSPKVFISYSWDSPEHSAWVHDFAAFLQKNGILTTLDQWDLLPGNQLPSFMRKGVGENEFVLMICTEKYKDRFDHRIAGVGFEAALIVEELARSGNTGKFIPILRQGDKISALPASLQEYNLLYLDFTAGAAKPPHDDLVRRLYRVESKRPPLGPSPYFST
jgi:hypothetical protein